MPPARVIAAVGLLGLLTAVPGAQTVRKANTATVTATIQQIDQTTRAVTLRNEKGEEDTFVAGPEVIRFNQLKVGDKVTLTFHESLVLEVSKPGAASTPAGDIIGAGRTKSQPGGGVVAQQTRRVTVKAVDLKTPSITVVTDDGRTVTRKVEDKKNLEGVKVGDKIDITYTQAVVIAAEPAK
jgi:Cu/Ag efflux protein CusF